MEHVIAQAKACGMSDYDTDLVLWSREQAELLRRMAVGERVSDQVDWENVAEEIESLGRSDWRELRRRIQVILSRASPDLCDEVLEKTRNVG
jgi:Domain of unknown function DUF29